MEFCYDCTRHHRSFERNLALLNYNDTASRSMSAIKYKNKREYLDFYSEALWLRFGRQIHFWNPDLFVPVPIHPTRRKIRGFNQAEVLAEKLSEKYRKHHGSLYPDPFKDGSGTGLWSDGLYW